MFCIIGDLKCKSPIFKDRANDHIHNFHRCVLTKRFFLAKIGDEHSRVVEYNPFAVSLAPGDGFTLDKSDEERMREINSRLERRLSRLASDHSGSVGSSSRLGAASTFTKRSGTHSTACNNIEPEAYYAIGHAQPQKIKLDDDFDENDFGDKFIREARLSREHEQKLKVWNN